MDGLALLQPAQDLLAEVCDHVGLDRLRVVPIESRGKGPSLIGRLPPTGDRDEHYFRSELLPYPRSDLVSVEMRQPNIQQGDVRARFGNGFQCRGTVIRYGHLMAFHAQEDGNAVGDVKIIVRNQDSTRRGLHTIGPHRSVLNAAFSVARSRVLAYRPRVSSPKGRAKAVLGRESDPLSGFVQPAD
jgi:hypothetical protein